MADRFILCSNCGTKNRVPEGKVGKPNCGNCHKELSLVGFNYSKINFGRLFLLCCGVGLAAYYYTNSGTTKITTTIPPTNRTVKLEAEPVYILPGVKKKPSSKLVAPLGIKSSAGSNYYVKLVNLRGQTTMTAFVRGGQYFEMLVPLGTYELRYAAGDTWYGEHLLFGHNTTYSKARELFDFTYDGTQYSGYTVELIMQTNGNLHTEIISENDF
jgi:hypothetical protein